MLPERLLLNRSKSFKQKKKDKHELEIIEETSKPKSVKDNEEEDLDQSPAPTEAMKKNPDDDLSSYDFEYNELQNYKAHHQDCQKKKSAYYIKAVKESLIESSKKSFLEAPLEPVKKKKKKRAKSLEKDEPEEKKFGFELPNTKSEVD